MISVLLSILGIALLIGCVCGLRVSILGFCALMAGTSASAMVASVAFGHSILWTLAATSLVCIGMQVGYVFGAIALGHRPRLEKRTPNPSGASASGQGSRRS